MLHQLPANGYRRKGPDDRHQFPVSRVMPCGKPPGTTNSKPGSILNIAEFPYANLFEKN
jgi:hypothetical protein